MRFLGFLRRESYEAKCSHCRVELQIERSEIQTGRYVCPECGHENGIPETILIEFKRNRAEEQRKLKEAEDREKERKQRRLAKQQALEREEKERRRIRQEEMERLRQLDQEAASGSSRAIARASPKGSLTILGSLLLVGGLCVAAYFFFVYDTTVSTQSTYIPGYGALGGGRVHNIGLQQDRQLGCIGGLIAAAVGAVMLIVESKIHSSSDT